MGDPSFWNNQESAQQTIAQLKSLKAIVDPLVEVQQFSEDLEALLEMAEEDASILEDVHAELGRLEKIVTELELKSLLNGPHDGTGAILTVHARDGGTDANDWAEMLLRMYLQWAQKNDYQVNLMDRNDNDIAGINSATISVRGPMAYGYLKGEIGIHRLVRISPFNSEGKRQTSFAAVDVSPEVSETSEIEIQDKDIREDTYRASGAGGQHVNKTDSAIRVTHLPTGIVVQCQNDRSQHRNRAAAIDMMRARLYELELQKREDATQAERETMTEIGWGHQIRSYVLNPYQMVKDLRTGMEKGNAQGVLDGGIDEFLEAALAIGGKSKD